LGSYDNIQVSIACDVGVNAIHSTKQALELVQEQDIILCTAGMEAILPEVIACSTNAIVLAVPSNVSSGIGEGVVSFWSISNISTPGLGIFNINGIASACRCIQIVNDLMREGVPRERISAFRRDILLTMDTTDKQTEQVERFVTGNYGKRHMVLKALPNASISLPRGSFDIEDIGIHRLYLHKSDKYEQLSGQTKIRIVVGGFADEHIAKEMLFYFRALYQGDVAIMEFQSISQMLKKVPEDLLTADIIVVVAGSSGTLPNFISGLLYGKLVIAVPCSEQALVSMVRSPVANCSHC
jgi:NCAIR mutase (PurE)-related protein